MDKHHNNKHKHHCHCEHCGKDENHKHENCACGCQEKNTHHEHHEEHCENCHHEHEKNAHHQHHHHEHHHHDDHHNHHHHEHHHHGHHGHHGHDHSAHLKDYLVRFIVSLILSIPVLVLSPMIQGWFNYSIDFTGRDYLVWFIATIIFIYGGWPFFMGGYFELKSKEPAMMSLVSLAIIVSYVYSALVTFGLSGMDFYWELVTLIVIMLLGHYLEMKSSMVASNALSSLTKLLPSEAHLVISATETKDILLSDLKHDDIVLVKPGEKIPVDGKICEGESLIDESMITGESQPVHKKMYDEVIGGTLNSDGILKVKVTKLGDETYLSQVVSLVESSLQSKSKTQRLADIAAKYLFYVSILVALITLITWSLIGETQEFVLEKVVTVIVIACPHALGVAIPLVTSISTSLAAKNGLLIKNRSSFEKARKTKHVIFDKTGTLTDGKFSVTQILSFHQSEKEILEIAKSLEMPSTHPIAQGILNYTHAYDHYEVKDYKNLPGYGVIGTMKDNVYGAVSVNYLIDQKISYDHTLHNELINQGLTSVFIIENKHVIGLITLKDQIKPSAVDAINTLNHMGIKTHMLTGDNDIVASNIAKELGITHFKANMLPDQKSSYIQNLKKHGEYILMTGDGINDAPALAEADLGVAIGAGTDVAIETADVILVRSEPKDVVTLLKLSQTTYRKMLENLFWALAYNVITLPLAAGILHFAGISISPALGAILMSLSTIVVAINAKFLKLK